MEMMLTALYDNGEKESFEVSNDSQAWKKTKDIFSKHQDARILVKGKDDELFRDLTLVKTKRGMTMVNAIKKAKGSPIEDALKAVSRNENAGGKKRKQGGCIFIVA